MVAESDLEYFERRRRESLERAEQAKDLDIARLHRSFAIHYTRAIELLRVSATYDMSA